jgi:N-acyl-D-aspartate/D-glutamate deacylase
MLDKKIVGGTIVDGTGRPGYAGDVGIKDGRIVAVGKVTEDAKETIDAAGRTVAPGFIDVHTHYDAQAFWDPTLSPSCYHGVTTIMGGFCGFSIAPLSKDAAPYLQRMLARVEGMPLKTLQDAVPWNWSSFGEFLGLLEGKVGLNAGFFVGHSAVRRVVMGERAVGEKATPEELEKMKALVDKSLTEGALGFSTTVSVTHNDGEGQPVPSRWADRSEFMELAKVVRKHEGAGLEMLPDVDFKPGTNELLSDFSLAGNRPVNWNALIVDGRANSAKIAEHQLSSATYARTQGAEVLALVVPQALKPYLNMRTWFAFDAFPGIWRDIAKLSVTERTARLKDPEVRKQLAEGVAAVSQEGFLATISKFEKYTPVSIQAEKNKKYQGRQVSEIAKEDGRTPLEIVLDIAIDDNLETLFNVDVGGDDKTAWELRGRLWADDRTLIGASDAGAHLDVIDSFAFSTSLLQKGVREHKVISLEQAVHKITQRPATYYGLIDRGELKVGYHADVVVFDPKTVGMAPVYQRYDVPGGRDFRIYADAVGIDHVFVNGTQVVRDGKHTGNLPGTVLRCGKDTRTVPMKALQELRAAAE